MVVSAEEAAIIRLMSQSLAGAAVLCGSRPSVSPDPTYSLVQSLAEASARQRRYWLRTQTWTDQDHAAVLAITQRIGREIDALVGGRAA